MVGRNVCAQKRGARLRWMRRQELPPHYLLRSSTRVVRPDDGERKEAHGVGALLGRGRKAEAESQQKKVIKT